jgi:hypothetical protein
MTTWRDLSGQEQAILVGVVLNRDGRRKVPVDRWQSDPFVYLRTFDLIIAIARQGDDVIYTISPQAISLLLSAPDDADGQRIFPTHVHIQEMKHKLRAK